MNLALASEDAVRRKLSGSETHSRCHGPVARSKSWIMPSSMVATCCRTAFAAASINSLDIGLRFCGIVEDAPLPGTNGSDTSPNSVADIIMMSVAILPSVPVIRPSNVTASANPSRDVPRRHRLAKAEFLAEKLLHLQPPFAD